MQGVGFEPTHPKILQLKCNPLDHSGTLAYYFYQELNLVLLHIIKADMLPLHHRNVLQGVGFEPTHPKILQLKCNPLDHSGTLAYFLLLATKLDY